MFKSIYNWLKTDNRPNVDNIVNLVPEIDAESSEVGHKLYGVTLGAWVYLGYTIVKWVDPNDEKKITSECDVHFFHNIKTEERKYVLVGDKYRVESFKHHSFVDRTCELWRAKEHEIYQPIHEKPSKWLQELMATKLDIPYYWDEYKKWWSQDTVKVQNDKAKKNKIKLGKKTKEETPANNVVTVDFGKKE